MIDIKFLRENPEIVKENIRKKFQDSKLPMVDEVIALDADRRKAQQEADKVMEAAKDEAVGMIVDEAKEEAARIIKRANEEALLEKKRIMDEAKQEMIAIASMMAGKVVTASIDTSIQDALVEETLKEIGESTWQS